MNSFPTLEQPDPAGFLFDSQFAFYRYLAIRTALENHVFEMLVHPRSAHKVALEIGRDREIVSRLLLALLAMGLVDLHDEGYVNVAAVNRYCVRSSPHYLGGALLFNHDCFGSAFQRQAELLRPSRKTEGWDDAAFAAGMEAGKRFVCEGALEHITSLVTGLPDFGTYESMLDLGCGAGTIGLEIAGANPDMRLTMLDLPPVIRAARREVALRKIGHRVTFVETDMFHDDIPGNHDLILASDSLYGAEDLDAFIKRLRRSLKPGGIMVLRHLECMDDARVSANNALLRFGGALAGMPGYVFPAGAVPRALLHAGLSSEGEHRFCHLGHEYVIHVARS